MYMTQNLGNLNIKMNTIHLKLAQMKANYKCLRVQFNTVLQ